MDTHKYKVQVRALVYKEGARYFARSLEMDLVGTGSSDRQALKKLQELVAEHVSFAVFKNDDSLILFKAEREYFDRWEKAAQAQLHNELFPDTAVQMEWRAAFITLSKEDVRKLKKSSRFSPVLESELAKS